MSKFEEFLDELTSLPPAIRRCLKRMKELDKEKEELSSMNNKKAKEFFLKMKKVRQSSHPTEEDEKQTIDFLRKNFTKI